MNLHKTRPVNKNASNHETYHQSQLHREQQKIPLPAHQSDAYLILELEVASAITLNNPLPNLQVKK